MVVGGVTPGRGDGDPRHKALIYTQGKKPMKRVDKLKALECQLAAALDECSDARNLAQLARQYRETLKEIEEIEGVTVDNDKIGEILKNRQTNGKSGAVR